MMIQPELLFKKFLKGHCTPVEAAQLMVHFSREDGDVDMVAFIEAHWDRQSSAEELYSTTFPNELHLQKLRQAIESEANTKASTVSTISGVPKGLRWHRFAAISAAAVVILALGLWVRDSQWSSQSPEGLVEKSAQKEIHPGSNRALLTRADGLSIELHDDPAGIQVNGGLVRYLDGTAIVSDLEYGSSSETLLLTTPRGGMYRVTLADGTKVWLNAASKLIYPSRFDDESRVVELEGEAYFEVSALTNKSGGRIPFHVKAAGQTVEVLGTQFNLKAYPKEQTVETTLLEGLVKIDETVLRPGQQALYSATGLVVKAVDAEMYAAWKDGNFYFDGQNIATVMQSLARWYDVEVAYEGQVTNHRFGGTISRYDRIEEVLSKLSRTQQVTFKIEGRKIIVRP